MIAAVSHVEDVSPHHNLHSSEISRHDVRLVVIDASAGASSPHPSPQLMCFSDLKTQLSQGDVLVVNDAATLPASLHGRTANGAEIELRLTQPPDASNQLHGVLFGAGDHRIPTEFRPRPPQVHVDERLVFSGWVATVVDVRGSQVVLSQDLHADALWQALYAAGKPVQYAHRVAPLALWDVQTAYATRPWAVEMPSAGRALTWSILLDLRRKGVHIASLTHAAGLSSLGDRETDRVLPLPEPYAIPASTLGLIGEARQRGNRVIAVGTSVVRALESAARRELGGPLRGHVSHRNQDLRGVARLRLGPTTRRKVVDAVISGLHVPGESHFELLRSFASAEQLHAGLSLAAQAGLSAHEFGDTCLILAPHIQN